MGAQCGSYKRRTLEIGGDGEAYADSGALRELLQAGDVAHDQRAARLQGENAGRLLDQCVQEPGMAASVSSAG